MAKDTLTAAELAERWNISKAHLAKLRIDGEGPAYFRIGDNPKRARVRYRISDIEAWEQRGNESA